MSAAMNTIEAKLADGERLDIEDGLYLFEETDLLRLGALARKYKKKCTGPFAYFNVNRHINLTNICVSKCRFCAYRRLCGRDGPVPPGG